MERGGQDIYLNFQSFLPAAVGDVASKAKPIFAAVLALDTRVLG